MRYTGIFFALQIIGLVGIGGNADARVVVRTETITGDSMDVDTGGILTNYGQIDVTNFILCPGCDLDIENYGKMDVDNFVISDNSTVRQIISSSGSAKRIDNLENFEVVITGASGLSLQNLSDVSNRARSVCFEDVSLDVDGAFLPENATVEFRDTITLNLKSDAALPADGLIFKNVVNHGRIVVNSENTDPMYVWRVVQDMRAINIRFVRETNYAKFMDPELGTFLNSLRYNPRGYRLVSRLDRASNMAQINNLLSQSAYTNPIKLMRGVAGFNADIMFDMPDVLDSNYGAVRPLVLTSGDSILYGARVGAMFNIGDKFAVGVHGHAGYMDYADGMDEYWAHIFGGGVNLNFNDEFIIARMMAGVTMAKFDVDAVYHNGRVIDAPIGYGAYATGDFGIQLHLPHNIFMVPTIGFDGVRNSVADMVDNNFRLHVGGDFGIDCGAYDVRYRYALRGRTYSNGDVGYGARVAVNSDTDDIGGDVSIMRVRHDDITFTEYSAMIRISF